MIQKSPIIRALLLTQGIYYLITGIWPVAHMRSFERISGPKTDDWLVKTLGMVLAIIGGILCVAGMRPRASLAPETALTAVGSASALASSDIVYGFTRRISAVYLLEGLAELALIAGWLLAWKQRR
ncbi:MAG: hypothetical protein R6X18_09445 [Chloroflexota bacterium]